MGKTDQQGIVFQGVPSLPLQVPEEIFQAQLELGGEAVLLWINLLLLARNRQPISMAGIAESMGLEVVQVEKALVKLADKGWINDEGYEIKLCVPTRIPEETMIERTEITESLLDHAQAGFEWLVNFWANRVGAPTPDEMQRLLEWIEKKRVSPEVIAVAIEEMCSTIDNPHFPYLEGVLRNWLAEGVYSYAQLMDKPYLSKVLPHSNGQTIHPEAESKWKELFPDEFDK